MLAYLARYTHPCTAIANSRLVAVDDNEVAFAYKDYRRNDRTAASCASPRTSSSDDLPLHVLPNGLRRIRHYGFLAKGEQSEKLAYVRDLLHVASKPQGEEVDPVPRRAASPVLPTRTHI